MRAAAESLAQPIPGVQDFSAKDRDRWLDRLAETISPAEDPGGQEVESVVAVMALQRADWLGLALVVVHAGPGSVR